MQEKLVVRLGDRRYRVERPFGDLPPGGVVSDVACCSRGHAFVLIRRDAYCDEPGPAIVELDPEGRRLAAWGGEAVLDGHMLAIDAHDRIHVVDRDAHEIVIFDRDGHRLGGLGNRHRPGEPFAHPTDVCFTAGGEILVSDGYANALVHRFTVDGEAIGRFGTPGEAPGAFKTPHCVWAMQDGRIVVADRDNDRLQLFAATGELLGVWRDHVRPMHVWGDGHGLLFVSDQVPRLSLLDAEGRLLGRCRPVLNGAHGGSIDPWGNLYLAEINPSRVTRLVRLD